MKSISQFFLLVALCASVMVSPASAESSFPEPLKGAKLTDLRLIPTQSGGRLKPFDEFARETILSLTGMRSFGKLDPSEMLISMLIEPRVWSDLPIIRVANDELKKQMLLDLDRKYFSPNELMKNNVFLQYAQGVQGQGAQVTSKGIDVTTSKKNPRTEELNRVVDRVTRFQNLIAGQLWMIMPDQTVALSVGTNQKWISLNESMKSDHPAIQAVMGMLKAYLERNPQEFNDKSQLARVRIAETVPSFQDHSYVMKAEVLYNLLRPFLQAMIFYLLAGILWMFAVAHRIPRMMAKVITLLAMIMHGLGFALRCYVAGRPPVTNMYESIIWVSFGVMVFALLIYAKHQHTILLTTSTILAGLSLFAADAAPMVMDPTIRPLVPVLRSNYWLTIHVLTITLSYAAFMLAMGISNVSLFRFTRPSSEANEQRISLLNQLSYRALMFGTVLLAAGTILGGIWADYSWGRFWGWDPKEVWALIALLAYMAVLHGRYAGWIGKYTLPLWTVICFSTVLMAWYGVNFILGVGLHSYGFSNGGQAVMAGFVILQGLFCAWVHLQKKKATSGSANVLA
jgi:cytochrome c-type biogenesis protein CcsB